MHFKEDEQYKFMVCDQNFNIFLPKKFQILHIRKSQAVENF